jgi:hypothetical protein
MQVLAPGVEHGEKTDLGAEMPRVCGDGTERLGGAPEQDGVDRLLVLEGDLGERRRQREHDVEIRNRQELCLPGRQPLGTRLPLALRAMAVATGNGRRPLPALWANSVMGSWRGDVGIFQ